MPLDFRHLQNLADRDDEHRMFAPHRPPVNLSGWKSPALGLRAKVCITLRRFCRVPVDGRDRGRDPGDNVHPELLVDVRRLPFLRPDLR